MPARALVASINRNGLDVLPGMLDSLVPQLSETGTSLLVFDNASDDGSACLVEELAASNTLVRLVRSPSNIGFGAAADSIAARTDAPVLVLVNTDTVFLPRSLETLLSCIESGPEIGLAGPRLLWPDGNLQQSMRDFPFPGRLLLEHLPILRRKTARYSPHDHGAFADWLVGAVMAVRMSAFRDVGGFSRDFGFFHEETDLMYRMRRRGWKVWFEPSAEVIHLCGSTTRRTYEGPLEIRYIPARLLFIRKHAGSASVAAYRLLMTGLLLARLASRSTAGRDGSERRSGSETGYLRRALAEVWRNPRPGEGAPPGSAPCGPG
jgi:GT2 family glycosyltransferase